MSQQSSYSHRGDCSHYDEGERRLMEVVLWMVLQMCVSGARGVAGRPVRIRAAVESGSASDAR